MKSNVTVTAKHVINIEIIPNELINGLIKTFELNNVFNPEYDYYWKLEEINGVEALNEYENISYHGTPCYQLHRAISDPKLIEAYKCIKKLSELIKEGRK